MQAVHAAAVPWLFKQPSAGTFPPDETRALISNPSNLIFIAEVSSVPTGYAYAAQLQAGLEVDKVGAEARRFAASWVPPRRIAATARLRELCESAGLRTAVVSASAIPIVIAAAPLAGFAPDRCHGIEVAVRAGRFTADVVQPIPYAGGKLEAIRKEGAIVLACGDSFNGDLAMLQAARIPVAVAPRSGSPLAAEARRQGWPVLDQDS